jgi:DegV family protein with EDD domain
MVSQMNPLDRVAVVVDSAASLPDWAIDDPLLHVVPMQLVIGGRTYLDGTEMSPTEFYRLQSGLSQATTTAAPTPQSYASTFETAALSSSSILCLCVARRYSAAHDSALLAVRRAQQSLPDVQIAALDSGSAAGGEGLIALEALRAANRGLDLTEVVKAAREVADKVSLVAFLDTLYYVWKGGRVPRLVYSGASLLGLKPMFELASGEVRAIGRPRTRARAMRRLVDAMRKRVGDRPVHVGVMHGDCPEDAQELRQAVELKFDCRGLFVSEFTPVMGAHTGPGLLGLAFWAQG